MRQDVRASDVWLRSDLVNIAAGLTVSVDLMAAAAPASAQAQAYRAGYRAAMAALLLTIGAAPEPPVDRSAGYFLGGVR